MRTVLRWGGRLLLALVILVLALLAPVLWVEGACRGTPVASFYEPLLPPEHRRPEARTLMTYPEWDIVYAYEDYAAVIGAGDPHEFGFLQAIAGFWRSACAMNRASAALGGADWTARQTIHVIGVSFTAELLAKALYEESLGRLATLVRGPARAPLDAVSARQAASYAAFLHQVPWYRWDFREDAAALDAAGTGAFRDRERALALAVEYRVKAAYARVIAAAVASTGFDALTMRSVVVGLSPEELGDVESVAVVRERSDGVEIETPRYAAFTSIARTLADRGGAFVEIAGNDDIMLTAITEGPEEVPGALLRRPRQGNPGWRQVLLLPVADLADALRDPALGVEHIHDY